MTTLELAEALARAVLVAVPGSTRFADDRAAVAAGAQAVFGVLRGSDTWFCRVITDTDGAIVQYRLPMEDPDG